MIWCLACKNNWVLLCFCWNFLQTCDLVEGVYLLIWWIFSRYWFLRTWCTVDWTNSDHPPLIIKEIPRSVEKRLSTFSSLQNIFHSGVNHLLWKMPKSSGYKTKLQHPSINNQKKNNQNKKKRKRNITYLNPPYSKSVKTNIERILIKLISKQNKWSLF